ncbi:MAG: hypothetical protein ACLFR2_09820 [Candidatus Kapaibacterium sp.]
MPEDKISTGRKYIEIYRHNKEFLYDKIKQNRWAVFIIILMSAAATVFYIDNVFEVNRLMREIRVMEKKQKQLSYYNDILRTRVIRLESAERIIPVAEDRLGMKKNDKTPVIIQNNE